MSSRRWQLKLLYDGQCSFCRREVHWLKRRDAKGQVALEDISDPAFDPRHYGLTAEQVAAALHGVLPDGRIVCGMDAVRAVYEVVGLGWLIAATRWPGIHWGADRLYRLFARHRLRLGRLSGKRCATGACATGVPK